MAKQSYKQFCPVAMAAEVLGTRWTIVLLRELGSGSTRFNDLRRGVPTMSPALLSRRLKELEKHGILRRHPNATNPAVMEYTLTPSGEDLRTIVDDIGAWGQKWVTEADTLRNLDAGYLMWDMRRNLDTRQLPQRPVMMQFTYTDKPSSGSNWWLTHDPKRSPELFSSDPGILVDLYVRTTLKLMTAIWLGRTDLEKSIADGNVALVGDPALSKSMRSWLGFSAFAQPV
ncbi:MAG: helix-turn-helix domain-containing protein [Pseudomonadota bacterium]